MDNVTAVDFAEACITALHATGSMEGEPTEHVLEAGAHILDKTKRGWQKNATYFYEKDVLSELKKRGVTEEDGRLALPSRRRQATQRRRKSSEK